MTQMQRKLPPVGGVSEGVGCTSGVVLGQRWDAPGGRASWNLAVAGAEKVASFPGCSRLQFLIAYCMQKQRGKAWEKESRA